METHQLQELVYRPDNSSGLLIYRVRDLDQFVDLWPKMVAGANDHDKQTLAEVLLHCAMEGLLLCVSLNNDLVGFCAASESGKGLATVHCLPTGPSAHLCIRFVRKWAREQGVERLILITHRLNGSNFRYIEKSLGFRRDAMIFTQPL